MNTNAHMNTEPLKSQIEITRYKYLGDLDWDENGTLYRPDTPGATQYVGPPSPEIDAAWEHIIPGTFVPSHYRPRVHTMLTPGN